MHSLRWKIILMAVLVVFIPVYLLNRDAIQFFDGYTRKAFEKNLKHYAFIVGEQYKLGIKKSNPETDQVEFDKECEQLFRQMGDEVSAHICVFNKTGKLLFDSKCGVESADVLQKRPEVVEALQGRLSTRARLTEDRQYMYYYIAQPIKDDEKNVLGVAYIVAHTNPIVLAIQRMMKNQRLATYIALTCAGLVALVLSLTMTRRLRRLMRETHAFALGRKPLGKPPRGGDEIAELGRSIHSMADQIELRNRYNRDFIQTTLHELKTPLTAIRGAAEVLESLDENQVKMGVEDENPTSSDVASNRKKFLGKIDVQVGRLMQLVGELRELTRVDVESSQDVRENIDYCQFVRDAVARLSDTFSEPHADLSVDLPSAKLCVNITPGRIEQVLANLLDNAFRYTPSTGQVTIRVENDTCIRTIVQDTGCGIAESNVDRVFERFFTTERSCQPRDYGSGLGLAIVVGIIHNHHGKIRVESEEGQGSRFIFELPFC